MRWWGPPKGRVAADVVSVCHASYTAGVLPPTGMDSAEGIAQVSGAHVTTFRAFLGLGVMTSISSSASTSLKMKLVVGRVFCAACSSSSYTSSWCATTSYLPRSVGRSVTWSVTWFGGVVGRVGGGDDEEDNVR